MAGEVIKELENLRKEVGEIEETKEIGEALNRVLETIKAIDFIKEDIKDLNKIKEKLKDEIRAIDQRISSIIYDLKVKKREVASNGRIGVYFNFDNIKDMEDLKEFVEYLGVFLVIYSRDVENFDFKKLIMDIFRSDNIKGHSYDDPEISFVVTISKKVLDRGLFIEGKVIRNNKVIEREHLEFKEREEDLVKEQYEKYKNTIEIAKRIVSEHIKDFEKIIRLRKILRELDNIKKLLDNF